MHSESFIRGRRLFSDDERSTMSSNRNNTGFPLWSSSGLNDANDTDLNSWMLSHAQSGNSSITTSVTIHVTPAEYHLVSWGLLWGGFLIAAAIAGYQVWKEHKAESATAEAEVTDDYETEPRRGRGRGRMSRSTSPHSARQIKPVVVMGDDGGDPDMDTRSIADHARSRFRKVLFVALVCRTAAIPIQLWADPIWSQVVADTVPELVFASAWSILIGFFVHLVDMINGIGPIMSTNSVPTVANPGGVSVGFVVHCIAYLVYAILIFTYFWNTVASILVYALLCCVYAGLFGSVSYFGPRLIMLVHSELFVQAPSNSPASIASTPNSGPSTPAARASNEKQSRSSASAVSSAASTPTSSPERGVRRLKKLIPSALRPERWPTRLALKVLFCCAMAIFVLGARTVGFARKVVAPPRYVLWWWQYGVLELLPSLICLLVLLNKSATGKPRNNTSNSKTLIPYHSVVKPPASRRGSEHMALLSGGGKGYASVEGP